MKQKIKIGKKKVSFQISCLIQAQARFSTIFGQRDLSGKFF